MSKKTNASVAALVAISCIISAVPAAAQGRHRDSDRDGRSDAREWNRDRDRDGRPDQYDRRDNRRGQHRWRYYGGKHGYNGYRGKWRTGQRYSNYRNQRFVISDYRAYDLPPPQRGYRYYRDNSGDIVMAAVATGIIGLIIGGALSNGR
jgi:Ni/Co efflux regulator RcnB